MAVDVTETEPTETPLGEAVDQAAEADLEAGFAASDDDTELTDDAPPARPDVATEGESDDDPAPVLEPVYVKLTEADFNRLQASAETVEKIAASLEQRFGTAFGHIGGLQQKLKEIQEATPRGQAVKLTAEDFAEMREEFPELADMQIKGLERVMSRLGGTGSAGLDEAKTAKLVDDKVGAVVTQIQRDALTDLHEDWEKVVGAEGSQTPYRKWLATQPKDYQDTLNTTRRPGVIARSIDKFKAFTAASATRQNGAPKPNPSADIRRRELAEAARTPRGVSAGRRGRTADDDLMAGFNDE